MLVAQLLVTLVLLVVILSPAAHAQSADEQEVPAGITLHHELPGGRWGIGSQSQSRAIIGAQASVNSCDWGRRRGRYDQYDSVISIINTGTEPIRITSFLLEGNNAEDFYIHDSLNVIDTIIDPEESLDVKVQFIPLTVGQKEAVVRFETAPVLESPLISTLRGFGTRPAIYASDYDFGHLPFGQPELKYSDRHEHMAFSTPSEEWFDSVTVTGFSFKSDKTDGVNDFRWAPVSGSLPFVLKAGERFEVEGWFKAQTRGLRWASLSIITSDGIGVTSYWTANAGISSVDGASGNSGVAVSASPNPATGSTLHVRYTAPRGRTDIDLIDQLGNVLRSLRLNHEEGESNQTLNIEGLPAGGYFLRIATGETVRTEPVVIVR